MTKRKASKKYQKGKNQKIFDEAESEKNYNIISMMKLFMGENEGRKLVYDKYYKGEYYMQRQHSVFTRFKMFLQEEYDKWDKRKPLFIVVTYKNHYTGIRIEKERVLLVDPNYDDELYTSISKKMRIVIKQVTNKDPEDYIFTCQKTKDEADSFCQTWTLILLCDPDFVPPERQCDKFKIILELYKWIITNHYSEYEEFVENQKEYGNWEYWKYTIEDYMSLKDITLDKFIQALYESNSAYSARGYSCLKF
jgi:hypothetical protein